MFRCLAITCGLLFVVSFAAGLHAPPKFVVNLDEPAEVRWKHVMANYKDVVADIKKVITTFLPAEALPLIETIATQIDDYIEAPYAMEMRGIAEALNCSVGDVVAANIIYDVSAFCTSIVSQDNQGRIWHSRNLDYGFTDILKNITIDVDFQKGGKTVYSVITYAGYVGVLTGQKPMGFTITVDERDQGSLLWNLLVGILDQKVVPVSFIVRDALANDVNFEAAVKRLANTPTAAPVYFIIGGVKPGEGAVITKGRLEADDIWRLDADSGRWFVLETNYDHWTTPPPNDNRRDPGIKAMNQMGRGSISVKSLFNVMSTPPVLNSHTTYTIVMSAGQPDLRQTWVRQ